MVLRLVIHDTVHNNGHTCLVNEYVRHAYKKEETHLIPSWIEERGTSVTSNVTRKKRSPILAAVGVAVGVSALFNLFTGSMTSKEIADIKEKQSVVFNHMQTLDNEVSNNHNDIVKIVTSVGSLYEYTHKSFNDISEKLKRFECSVKHELAELSFALQRDRMMNKLYVDLVGSIVAIFNHHPTPLLLPMRTIKELIKQNIEFFANTIYIDHEYLVYHYGFIFPVLPMNSEALGYILRLPRIMKPSLTSLYSLSSTGILINNKKTARVDATGRLAMSVSGSVLRLSCSITPRRQRSFSTGSAALLILCRVFFARSSTSDVSQSAGNGHNLDDRDLTPFDPGQADADRVLFPESTYEDKSAQLAGTYRVASRSGEAGGAVRGAAGVEGPGGAWRGLEVGRRVYRQRARPAAAAGPSPALCAEQPETRATENAEITREPQMNMD